MGGIAGWDTGSAARPREPLAKVAGLERVLGPAAFGQQGRGRELHFPDHPVSRLDLEQSALDDLLLLAYEWRGVPTGKENPVTKPKEEFPGAVPTDPKLNSLLRQFIRPTNDVPAVDKLLADVKSHIKGNPELTKQAVDGWTRILHFGDHYGTDYARKVGREFLESLNQAKDGKPKSE